ncbi:MAG: GNAT family N-acetyltransferase [Planctomycetota bacterium]|nr:GNAT family N-acetyltransferase [Planctomycetota bacterium]
MRTLADTVTHADTVIRPFASGDEAQLLRSFSEAFGAVDPNYQPWSAARWRWQFLENPAGTRLMAAFDAEGRAIAQYAGVPQRARLDGERVYFTQSVGSFCLPEARGLGHHSLFVRTGFEYAKEYVSPGGDAWTWGYPVLPARRIGERSLGYERVRQQMMLLAEPSAINAPASSAEVTETGEFTEEVDGLFERLVARHPAVCERESRWLDWRYRRHPEHRYRIAMAHQAGALKGYAVARAQDFQGERRLVVCDWWCEEAGEGALLTWLADLAREVGVESVAACFAHAGAEFQEWQTAGFQVAPTSLILSGRSHTRRAPFWFAPRWFTTLGDSDLC